MPLGTRKKGCRSRDNKLYRRRIRHKVQSPHWYPRPPHPSVNWIQNWGSINPCSLNQEQPPYAVSCDKRFWVCRKIGPFTVHHYLDEGLALFINTDPIGKTPVYTFTREWVEIYLNYDCLYTEERDNQYVKEFNGHRTPWLFCKGSRSHNDASAWARNCIFGINRFCHLDICVRYLLRIAHPNL